MQRILTPLIVALWMGSAGCHLADRPDWAIYEDVVTRSPHRRGDFADCARLVDPNLRGDCAMLVALGVAAEERRAPDTHCGEVPEALWRDECHFLAAEALRKRGNTDAAVQACRAAGRFASDCALHLWQRASVALVKRHGHGRLADMAEPARRMYTRWEARVGDFSDFRTRFWLKVFRQLWSEPRPVDAHLCAELGAELQPKCVAGAGVVLDQALRVSLSDPKWAEAFCASEAPSSGGLSALPNPFPELARFQAHPGLDVVVQTFHQSFCDRGGVPPHPDPPGRIPSGRPAGPLP
jgi:hypothetical protein